MNALAIQFDLFEPIPTELEMMAMDIKAMRESQDRVRKKLFAENSALKKKIMELGYLEQRLERLEKNICK
jgi:hypothetical protein